MRNRTTTSFDGTCIAYSVSGVAETALLFIHGGMSDRSFWDGQHAAFSERFRVMALDLAAHGESGQNRQELGIPQFGRDVAAVMDAERVSRSVLIGNSLEARPHGSGSAHGDARTGGDRRGSFQDIGRTMDANQMREMADAWRRDFRGSLDQMLAYPALSRYRSRLYMRTLWQRMSKMPMEVVSAMFRSFGGYDTGAVARQLHVPIRCINGDRFPMDIEAIRRIVPDFDAVVLPHTGHYPMLESAPRSSTAGSVKFSRAWESPEWIGAGSPIGTIMGPPR